MKTKAILISLLLISQSYAGQLRIEKVDLQELVNQSQAILLVEARTRFVSTHKERIWCGLKTRLLEYPVFNYTVRKILYLDKQNIRSGDTIRVHAAYEDLETYQAKEYLCKGMSISLFMRQYKEEADLVRPHSYVIFLVENKGIYYFTVLNAWEEVSQTANIESAIQKKKRLNKEKK